MIVEEGLARQLPLFLLYQDDGRHLHLEKAAALALLVVRDLLEDLYPIKKIHCL